MMINSILASRTSKDTVLHIGPGVFYEQIRYEDARANVTIVEPDSDRLMRLQLRLAGCEHVTLIESAALPNGRKPILQKYSLSMMDSFNEVIPRFQKVFPGIHKTQTRKVEKLRIDQLLELLPDVHRNEDVLVLDAIGDELELLRGLEKEGGLARFSQVIVRTMRKSLYLDGSNSEEVQQWLSERFFDRPLDLNDSDPDFPVLYVSKNSEAEKAEELDSVISERDAARSDLSVALRMQSMASADLEDLQSRYSQLKQDKDRQDALLQKVTQRLVSASEVFQNISKADTLTKEVSVASEITTKD